MLRRSASYEGVEEEEIGGVSVVQGYQMGVGGGFGGMVVAEMGD